ncbi:glycosyl transferase [Paenibacillus marchantiophytorum]|uniref:Glycosyl transferase n=1 Tax=Paenibacillus marchantiophytorum TaxID=1619310 RepID=A0ABQ2BTV4_9BACL|nr:glycosyltransferase family 2 protein [Paenibacillus marchantiophytorum]GGI46244.1 glycosyl transferase [Paenibacillus marchantiophytorum]
MTKKISIVTPSYNQGIFLKRTIDSILDQKVQDLELIVFDGGSKDSSVEILNSYGDLLSYVSQKDEGQSDAVNKGLTHATGEIIGWLNSDDVYYPESLNKIIEVFNNNPDVDVIYGKADHIDENDNYLEDYYTEQWDYEKLKGICYICQPAVFFRRSVIEKYGILNKNLRYCMDYEYWLRIGQNKPFYFLDQKLAGSRLYSDNKTLGSRRAVHEEIIVMLKEKFGSAPEKWIYNLAHVITEEAGYSRENAIANYKFVKALVKKSAFLFMKYQKYIAFNQVRAMLSWLKSSRKAMLEAK